MNPEIVSCEEDELLHVALCKTETTVCEATLCEATTPEPEPEPEPERTWFQKLCACFGKPKYECLKCHKITQHRQEEPPLHDFYQSDNTTSVFCKRCGYEPTKFVHTEKGLRVKVFCGCSHVWQKKA